MRPAQLSLSDAALSEILDAAEASFPTTRRALSEATGLGLSTVTRAESLCLSRGIWRRAPGVDPISGRPCRILRPAEDLLLPLLTLTRESGTVRVVDTALEVRASAVTTLHPAAPPEETLRLLCRRFLSLLRGCGDGGQVTAPVLLVEPSYPAAVPALRDVVADALGRPPLAVMSHGEAVSRALRLGACADRGDSLLFLSVGPGPHACLLLRDGRVWKPSPLGDNLTATLSRVLQKQEPSAEGIRRGVATFLTELCRFLRPDRICLEDTRGILPDGEVLAALLPEGVEVTVFPVAEGLTTAETGGVLAGRRMLWERMLLG